MNVNAVPTPHVPQTNSQLAPAKQARDAIAADPSLDATPFGKLVSQYAQNRNPRASAEG
jgi:hypothetical protein